MSEIRMVGWRRCRDGRAGEAEPSAHGFLFNDSDIAVVIGMPGAQVGGEIGTMIPDDFKRHAWSGRATTRNDEQGGHAWDGHGAI
jgi:hypothetical protein